MPITRYPNYLIIFLIVIFCVSIVQSAEKPEHKNKKTQEEQEKPAPAKQEEKTTSMTLMDLLRLKITGLSGSGIQILSSGSYETSNDGWITVKENAEIQIGITKSLLADTIRFNPSQNILRAEGNVILLENQMRISGDILDLNLADNTGTISNPYVETGEGFILSGRNLDKIGPDTYKIYGAKVTTCNQPTPQWTMAASSITIKAGETGTFRNVRLNMMDKVPVFYLPWLSVPLDRKRGTGFLMPEFGTSDYHGFNVTNRFFWAINDNHDATLGLDYYEKRGNRYSFEYRNDLGDGNVTSLYYYFIDDKSYPKVRFDSRIVNRQKLPLNFKTYTDLEFVSDNEYERDFISRDKFYSPLFKKTMALVNNTNGYSFSAGWNDLDRFRTRNRISQIRYLPRIDFQAREKQIIDTPLYYSFKTNFVRPHIREIFRRSEFDREDVITDESYNRFDLQGELKAPLKTFAPWLTVTPSFTARTTQYSRSLDEQGDYVDESLNRNFYDVGVEIVGPVFSKIFGDRTKSNNLFKHVIEPRVSYLYRSDIGDGVEDKIIILDQEDTFFRVHEVKWSVNSTIYHKRNYPESNRQGSVSELLNISVSQYVSVEDDLLTSFDKRYVFNLSNIEADTRFSPLLFDLSTRIGYNLYAYSRIEYDTQENTLSNYTLGGSLNVNALRYFFGWYRTVGIVRFDRVGVTRSSSNRFVTSGSYNLFDGLMRVSGAWDYDFNRKQVLHYLARVDINGQCLGASFEIRKLNLLGQNDLQTRFGIIIGGLGRLLSGGNDQ